jgi:hypothetical protein
LRFIGVLDRRAQSANIAHMSDFARQIAALRGLPPPPDKPRMRPLELPDPTDVTAKRTDQRSEADICDRLGDWLREAGYEVFFEVPLDDYRPDVVGFRNDQTLAIEAKRKDAIGVIRQGMRVARRVDIAYVALPFGAADLVVSLLAGLERDISSRAAGRKPPAMPGVLVVGPTRVEELRPPLGRPYRRMLTAELREAAERFGAERGGVPSVDQIERNVDIWRRLVAGESLTDLAAEYRLSMVGARTAMKRLSLWREHLAGCGGYPCVARHPADREFFTYAHKHDEALRTLPGR